MVVIYYITYGLGILVLSHFLIPVISPISTTFFQESIVDLGETPWSIYVKNLFNPAELELIPGGRNYVSQISNLSGVIGLLGIIMWLGCIKKNARAAKIATVISVIFGFSMMVAGLWQFIGRGGVYIIGVGAAFTPPEWIRSDGWGLWEFFTGSFACGLTVLYLLHQPFETLPKEPILTPKWENIWQKLGGVFLIALPCAMIVGDRLSGWFDWSLLIYLIEVAFVLVYLLRIYQKRSFPNVWTVLMVVLGGCVTFYILHFPNPEAQFIRAMQWSVIIATTIAIFISWKLLLKRSVDKT